MHDWKNAFTVAVVFSEIIWPGLAPFLPLRKLKTYNKKNTFSLFFNTLQQKVNAQHTIYASIFLFFSGPRDVSRTI